MVQTEKLVLLLKVSVSEDWVDPYVCEPSFSCFLSASAFLKNTTDI